MSRGPKKRVAGKKCQVSRLVMEEIVGRKLTFDDVVHHKDENPWNNSPDNLQLMTRSHHTIHHRKGTKYSEETKRKISMHNGSKKLSLDDVRSVKEMLKRGDEGSTVARRFGVHHATISGIKTGKNWGWVV